MVEAPASLQQLQILVGATMVPVLQVVIRKYLTINAFFYTLFSRYCFSIMIPFRKNFTLQAISPSSQLYLESLVQMGPLLSDLRWRNSNSDQVREGGGKEWRSRMLRIDNVHIDLQHQQLFR